MARFCLSTGNRRQTPRKYVRACSLISRFTVFVSLLLLSEEGDRSFTVEVK